ncbi:MAG: hypothetical protein C4K60_06430 [Ideonella sp. MAG2]|nr:MAG: hypothetical protein C4K60_06430 [Ideonella sp. MAG2]
MSQTHVAPPSLGTLPNVARTASASATTLIVVGETATPAPWVADAKWQAALPGAGSVLALGLEACHQAQAHCQRHPQAVWTGIRLPGERYPEPCPPGLSKVLPLDTLVGDSVAELAEVMPAVDLLVLSPAWVALPGASALLARLSHLCTPGARLVLALDNAASFEHLSHLLQGDQTPEGVGADPAQALALQAPATAYKALMDAGWMPHMVDHHRSPAASPSLERAVREAAQAAGVGSGCMDVVYRMRRLIISAQRSLAHAPREAGPARFTVVVPTTEERQLRANVEASPGLAEVQARIVSCRQAVNPAQALAQSLPHCDTDWILLAHQDVYFAQGFGEQLNAVLASIPPEQRRQTLIGFIGMAVHPDTHQPVPAGHVIDRLHQADHAASDSALSLDEVAVVLSRDSLHQIDPAQGWHLWATDLCLTAIAEHRVFARILRLPLFHNSRTGWNLPAAFVQGAERLMAKHPGFVPIHTLCGQLDAGFLARQRQATH